MSTAAEHGTFIEQLLDEVEATAGPVAWPRVEALVTALVELYGEALERLVAQARVSALDPLAFDAALAKDELLLSLLALRGVAPFTDLIGHRSPDRQVQKSFATVSRDAPLISAERLVRSRP